MNLWGITDIGIVRNDNQDCYHFEQLDEHTALAIVCDGMGGARGGSVASQTAVSSFAEAARQIYSQDPAARWDDTLRMAAEAANETVHQKSLEDAECRGMGTTLVAAAILKDEIHVVNVGDSRLYLIENGDISRVTKDHSYVEELVDRGDITREEARTHPKKNLITRALGVDRSVRVDLFCRENRGGYLLLCSDGLSNLLTDEEIRSEVVAEGKDSCCQRLLRIALDRGAPDNVTVVVAQL